ncbi:ABSCISIC ACID-INSENSITIVE 5-like protein 2 [Daucus carota subsp. sativus]|nr:PREDICTED: ABSCISIC ACID-INSENSITIVE 5-like protein 2 [Daucus carota subsp. sativus]XP_017254789.1 PREDICTED: ABSCISIC ACID-INSENSITIVE 5-like protein 2 [Daucus carota subsp. sativus]
MGTQTMGSQGSYGSGGSREMQESGKDFLAQQNSLYNLTLDEVQSQLGHLGKPLTSMNLDEFLKSVWTVEANQGLGRVDYGASQNGLLASGSGLYRQSSVTLPRDLSKKTVDEVWKDIQQGQNKNSTRMSNRERNSTFGEMTVEDFLVKAGVVTEGGKASGPVFGVEPVALPQQSSPQTPWLNYQIPSTHQPTQQQNMLSVFMPGNIVQPSLSLSSNTILDVYNETQMTISPSPLMGTLSDTQTPGRKRNASGDVVEKTVERRQKRMIKNRESAARSRARKQAYTHELENKVQRLEEENERLRRQKEAENLLPCVQLPEPKYQLRRTSSADF